MCSGSEAGSCFRLIDFVYHSTTLGLRLIKKNSLDSGHSKGGLRRVYGMGSMGRDDVIRWRVHGMGLGAEWLEVGG